MASRRPGLLTFVAVVAIVLGAMTTLTALSNVVVNKPPLARPSAVPTGAAARPDAQIVAAQVELQRQMVEIKQRHRGLFLMALPFSLLASGMMILGGAWALSLRRGSRPLLIAGMAVGLVVGLVLAKPTFAVQVEMSEATSTMMKTIFDATNSSTTNSGHVRLAKTMTAVGKAGAMAGLGVSIAIAVAKAGFLIFALVYLTRARTRALFVAANAPSQIE